MTEVDSITRLAQELDETRVRAFIRREMWQFLLDIGWTNDPEPPAPDAKSRPAEPPAAENSRAAELAALRARFTLRP